MGNRFLPDENNLGPFLLPPVMVVSEMLVGENYDEKVLAITDNFGCIVTFYDLLEILTAVKPFYDRVPDRELERYNKHHIEKPDKWKERKPQPKPEPKQYPGYVYLLKSGPHYKIGVSGNVDNRIKQLATLPPFEIELVHIIKTDDMYSLEREIHNRFANKRVNGEWFELDEADIEYIKSLQGGGR